MDRRQPRALTSGFRKQSHSVAERQWGIVTWAQLRRRGIGEASISRALRSGRLHEIHPGVYSITPPSLIQSEAWHAAAVLAGGGGACLCAESAAWWARLRAQRPADIHVATGHRHAALDGIRWHRLRLAPAERIKLRRMPITALERIPLDVAAHLSLWDLKGVLAELEFRYGIGPEAVTLRRGYRGAAKLRSAVAEHTPELALTRSKLEEAFVAFLVGHGFALPSFNHPVGLSTVDAVYAEQGVVIELDGVAGHSGERRVLRDHRRDLHRRADGLLPIRYHHAQLVDPRDALLVAAELERLGIPRG